MRDANLRMYMGNLCNDSPMYDYVEQIAGRTVQASSSSAEEQKDGGRQSNKKQLPERRKDQPEQNDMVSDLILQDAVLSEADVMQQMQNGQGLESIGELAQASFSDDEVSLFSYQNGLNEKFCI